MLVEWKWDNEPFREFVDHVIVEEWDKGIWSMELRIVDMYGHDIYEALRQVDTSSTKVELIQEDNSFARCVDGVFEDRNDDPKKMQT